MSAGCSILLRSSGKTTTTYGLPGMETDNLFPHVRLEVIKDDKCGGWEKIMALDMKRLYLKRIQYKMGSQ